MALNITSNNDPFYRYKMQPIQTKIIFKRGKLTQITNIESIAKSLNRSKESILKFFHLKLNTQLILGMLSGEHKKDLLQELLKEYIGDFVTCSHCENPETVLLNEGKIFMRCKACGKENVIKSGNVKMIKYFQKEIPPEEEPDVEAPKMKDTEVVWFSDVSEEAVKQRRKQFFDKNE